MFENDVISGKCPRRVVLWNCSIGQSHFFADHLGEGLGMFENRGPSKSL